MAIKWKKLNNIRILAYALGVSMAISGVIKLLGAGAPYGTWDISFLELADGDFQNSASFARYISCRLEDFLYMACGDYVGGYGNFVYQDTVYPGYQEAGTLEYFAGAEENEAVYEGGISDRQTQNVEENGLSKTEKVKSAQNYHNNIKDDKNLLYRISYQGKELYSNMDENEWEGGLDKLPSGYNFALQFDGEKAKVLKGGREVDIYGDGIYHEENDWKIPGYTNLPVKEKWKEAEIILFAAKEPLLYTANIYREDGWASNNETYALFQEFLSARKQFMEGIAYGVAGMVLLFFYLIQKKEKREAGKFIANYTRRIWFEWKALLFLFVTVGCCVIWFGQNEELGFYAQDMAAELGLGGISYKTYVFSMAEWLFSRMQGNIAFALSVFWAWHIFICDLRYNKGSYKNGWIGKTAALLEVKSLQMPFARRLVKRTYVCFYLTLALCLLLFALFLWTLLFGCPIQYVDSSGWIDTAGGNIWITLPLFAGTALAVALLLAECRYLKKCKQMAADLDLLSERISGIRQGSYTPSAFEEDSDIRKMAEDLDEISLGLETAVEERIRSERMKVELIANVSHDIKTPLTSLISYIQLLKQEEGLAEHIVDYIRILDEKSDRLKNMVQDVFTVSQAAGGQLEVNMEKLDLGKLLYQTLADMDEVIEKSPVTIKTEIPNDPVMVQADGQRMYRVFQNIIGNAVKYSLAGSRVYLTLKEEGEFAAACVKNTSSHELLHGLDFTERFFRGDKSRTDGGSGLGLSIAKSFTEACGGEFCLETNADLFVVTVRVRKG